MRKHRTKGTIHYLKIDPKKDSTIPKISYKEFLRRLSEMHAYDRSKIQTDILPYIGVDPNLKAGGAPILLPNPANVDMTDASEASLRAQGAALLGIFNYVAANGKLERAKQRLYQEPNKPIVIMEGDSWFEYPVFLTDVSDYMIQQSQFIAYSVAAAGDEVENMAEKAREDDYSFGLHPSEHKRVACFLLSGGGNDIVGKNLETILIPDVKSSNPSDYIHDKNYNKRLNELMGYYREIIVGVTTRYTNKDFRVLIHGYDYGIPHGPVDWEAPQRDGWTGKYLRAAGVPDEKRDLQYKIVQELIDRFNESQIKLAKEFKGQVIHVDNRKTIPRLIESETADWIGSDPKEAGWNDELHPNSLGFAKVAKNFLKAIG